MEKGVVSAWITRVVWEGSEEVVRGQDEREARVIAREVCRWVLGVELGETAA
jgi:Ni,Fe-hydrogenase I large subunit